LCGPSLSNLMRIVATWRIRWIGLCTAVVMRPATATTFISCRLDDCSSLPNTILRKLRSVQHATARLITGTRRSDHNYLADVTQTPLAAHPRARQLQTSKWHTWFASGSPGRRLSRPTWPTTAVSCPTALGALCSQLTFRLAWCRGPWLIITACHGHSVVMATELLLPRDLACGTLFQTSTTDCSDDG